MPTVIADRRQLHHQPCRGAYRVGGFTLVELLIVIGIIAILIAILMPVVTKARLQARRTSDLSNIHQMAVACFVYAAQSHGDWPLGSRLGNDTITPTDNDDIQWVNTWTFAYFLASMTTQKAADAWLLAPYDPSARMEESLRRSLACTTMIDTPDIGMYACVGIPMFRYDPFHQGQYQSFMGYNYWGRRPPRVTGQLYDNHGNAVSPASQFIFSQKQGQRGSTDVLLTCDAFSTASQGAELPHFGSGDVFSVNALPCATPGDGRTGPTAGMNGLCCGYTDGSARWVPRQQLWSVTSGSDYWYYFDGTHNR